MSAEFDFARLHARLDAAAEALSERAAGAEARREQVLRERAEALARARTEAEHVSLTVMSFSLCGSRYGVPFGQLDQVVECANLCALQGAPPAVLGAIAVRAGIIPVLDLRVLFGLAGGSLADLRFVLVVSSGGEHFGLAVEQTEGARGLESRQLQPPPGPPFSALTTDGLLVVDVDRLVLPS